MTTIREVDAYLSEIQANPPVDGVWIESINMFFDGQGQRMTGMHSPKQCEGRGCPIHNPSDHHLRHLPLVYRYADIAVEPIIAERVCEHNIGHPDPDFLAFIRERWRVTTVAAGLECSTSLGDYGSASSFYT